MPNVDDIAGKVIEVLKTDSNLAEVKEWQEVNNLITLKSPGVSVGIEKETFETYDRESDNANAALKIFVWVKDADPIKGESKVRQLAHYIRSVLSKDIYLGGMIDSGFVAGIEYLTGDTGKGLLLHMAELDYQVSYLAPRIVKDPAPIINEIATNLA